VLVNFDSYSIIPILKSCAELSSLYPRENPTVRNKLSQMIVRIQEVVGTRTGMSLSFTGKTISINGNRITNNQLKRPFSSWLMECAARSHFSELIISGQINETVAFNLGRILQDVSQKRIPFQSLKERILMDCGELVQITHISQSVQGGFEEQNSEIEKKAPEEQSKSGHTPLKGNLKPTQEVSTKRLFVIPENEKQALAAFIVKNIEKGSKQQVFNNILEMMKDIQEKNQEVAFLAANSLDYSIDVIININQSGMLQHLNEEMMNVLPNISLDDIFTLAVEMQLKMMKQFRASQAAGPYLNGVKKFVEISKKMGFSRKEVLRKAIFQLMDTSFTSFLLSLTSSTHALKDKATKLFTLYPTELADSLFRVLFFSENLEERKRVLTFLMKAGFAIQPLIIQYLKQSVKNSSPWYVKRNLLFLFCKFPTNDLSPLIDELRKDQHPKLQQQLLFACLRLKSPKAVELGTEKIAKMSYDQMTSFLPVIIHTQNKAYDQVLIDHFHRLTNEADQVKILVALHALLTLKTKQLFEAILTAKKMMSFKYTTTLREAAAKGLFLFGDRQAHSIFVNLKDDKEETVRSWAQKYLAEKPTG